MLTPPSPPVPPLSTITLSTKTQARPTSHGDISEGNYLTPLFPWVQGAALWVNWFLVCHLPSNGFVALGMYMAAAVVHYVCYGASHSVGNNSGWSSILGTAGVSKHGGGIDGVGERGRGGTNGCSPLSTMDSQHLARVCIEEGADAPLLGGMGGSGDKPSNIEAHTIQGGDTVDPGLVSVVSAAAHPVLTPGPAPVHEQLVRRRSADGLR